MIPSIITAAGGLLVAALGWVVSQARRRDDRASSLIDDLAEQVIAQRDAAAAQRVLTDEATATLRLMLDYIYVLREHIERTGHMPPPWPDSLTRR